MSVIAGALGVLLLAGCGGPPGSAEAESTQSATASSPAPTPTPTEVSEPFTELTFAAGADLDPAEWAVGWDDQFQTAEGFSVLAPDDGNGSWSYLDESTGCAVSFYQGALTDVELSGDDSLDTDRMLAAILGASITGLTVDDVRANAGNDSFVQTRPGGTVAIRSIGGTTSDGGTWLDSARMFSALGMGHYVSIQCPAGQNANDEREKLRGEYLRFIVESSANG